ncbi:transposase-like protein [Paenibacillus sp. V4I9]|nr:transposase-like protein [Paenibacillus sp. V4I9]
MGINEQGYREILGFYIGGQESANGWRDVLKDLYRRGAEEVLLVGSKNLYNRKRHEYCG